MAIESLSIQAIKDALAANDPRQLNSARKLLDHVRRLKTDEGFKDPSFRDAGLVRINENPAEVPFFCQPPWEFNSQTRAFKLDGREVILSPNDWSLLTTFFVNAERPLDWREIADYLGLGADRLGVNTLVRYRIFTLRRAIEPAPENPLYLVTRKGSGYIFYPQGKPNETRTRF